MSSTQQRNTQGLFSDRFCLLTTNFIREFDTRLHGKLVYRHTTDFYNKNHISVYPASRAFLSSKCLACTQAFTSLVFRVGWPVFSVPEGAKQANQAISSAT